MKIHFLLILVFISVLCCKTDKRGVDNQKTMDHSQAREFNYIKDFPAYTEDSLVNVVIEIPAGTNQKWEVEKTEGKLVHQLVGGTPRIIKYLAYPANYGMVPRSILPKTQGGDGDPLDILVLGPAAVRGEVIPVKVIGVLRLLDRGEIDDKLIAVSHDSPLFAMNSIEELNERYIGISTIIETWFSNYKGPGMVKSDGYRSRDIAMNILNKAISSFYNQKK